MPSKKKTAPTKAMETSESEESDDDSELLDAEIDDMEGVERGSATETDDSNDESDSDMESDDEVAESGENESVSMNGDAEHSPQSSTVVQTSAGKDKNWLDMYEEAKQFVASHGTMLVPFNHRLFPWLKDQATLFSRERAGAKGILAAERKQRLKILGMDDFLDNPVHKLRNVHVELVWLGEKSRDKASGKSTLFNWKFIRRHASKELSAEMAEKETFGKYKNSKLPSLVGRGNQYRAAFDAFREEVQAAMDSGVELKLLAENSMITPEAVKESSDEESSEDEASDGAAVKATTYDSDDSSSVNLDEMVKNAAFDDDGSSSASDADNDDLQVVSKVPDKWSLNAMEEEVAWLGEESTVASKNKNFDWNFIREHASPELRSLIEEREIFTKYKHQKMVRLLGRIQNKSVKRNFEIKREKIRKKLAGGYRRQNMKKVLASSTRSDETEEDMIGLGTAGLSLWQDTSTLELTAAEEDLAWLLEEQARSSKSTGVVDWEYVLEHSSPPLKHVIEAKKADEAKSSEKLGLLLRSKPGIKEAFDMKRSEIRKKLADGYQRVSVARASSSTPTKTPTSRSKKSLNDYEVEMAHLIEESMFFSDSGRSDWAFIEQYASPELMEHMKAREIFTKFKNKKLPKLVRLHDDIVGKAFQAKRLEVRQSLVEGVRREKTKTILPKSPGSRWEGIFGENCGLSRGKKRSAAEACLEDGEELQKLTEVQQELCWLMQESQFANGTTQTDWSFVEKHASKKLEQVIQERKDRNTKYRTVYAFFNIQSNPRLKRAYEHKCLEVRGMLDSGYRRKGMEDILPMAGEEKDQFEVILTPTPSRKAGEIRQRANATIEDGFLDSNQVASAKGFEKGRSVSVRADGNEWGKLTLDTFIDIKMRGGGYSRQYKVRLKNGEFGWLGQDDVQHEDKPSCAETRQEKVGSPSVGDKGEVLVVPSSNTEATQCAPISLYGVYESVFVSMFPTESPEVALPGLRKVPVAKTAQDELKDLIGELRFQRENYRQEMRRQRDRFEAHASLMEHLEQKAMDVLAKEADKEEGADEKMEDVGGTSANV